MGNQKSMLPPSKFESALDDALRNLRKVLLRTSSSSLRKKGRLSHLKDDSLRIANLLIRVTKQDSFPIDVYSAAQEMRIHTIIEDQKDSGPTDKLLPDESGFTLRLACTGSTARKRATIAHEIGHTLFYDLRKQPPTRLLSYRPFSANEDKEEWIAWDFARALLLPEEHLTMEVSSKEYLSNPREIIEIAEKAEVSVELACHRLARDLNFWDPCMMFVSTLEKSDIPKETVRIYRTRNFPKLNIRGKAGLLSSIEYKKILEPISLEVSDSSSGYVEVNNVPVWIKILRYSTRPKRILNLMETPFESVGRA